MDRSSGFGSTPSNYSLYSNSLSLRLPYSVKLATERKSLTHYAKGTQSPYEYLALEDGPPIFEQDVTCPALLLMPLVPHQQFHIPGYHRLWPNFPDRSTVVSVIKH